MDLFWLDKVIVNGIKSLKNMTGYEFFMYSLFAWGIVQSVFKDTEKVKK